VATTLMRWSVIVALTAWSPPAQMPSTPMRGVTALGVEVRRKAEVARHGDRTVEEGDGVHWSFSAVVAVKGPAGRLEPVRPGCAAFRRWGRACLSGAPAVPPSLGGTNATSTAPQGRRARNSAPVPPAGRYEAAGLAGQLL
jgi:hypothetical protein